MSIQKFSFPYYIRSSKTEETLRFISLFKDEIDNIPENTVSSRVLMRSLNLDTTYKHNVFKKAYMEYFKVKILENL